MPGQVHLTAPGLRCLRCSLSLPIKHSFFNERSLNSLIAVPSMFSIRDLWSEMPCQQHFSPLQQVASLLLLPFLSPKEWLDSSATKSPSFLNGPLLFPSCIPRRSGGPPPRDSFMANLSFSRDSLFSHILESIPLCSFLTLLLRNAPGYALVPRLSPLRPLL